MASRYSGASAVSDVPAKVHSASLLDLSLNLPVVIEFFDEPAKVKRILTHLKDILPPGHVISWTAKVNEG